MIKKIITLLLSISLILLAGCQSMRLAKSTNTLSADAYINLAATSGYPKKQHYLILAAKQLIKERNLDKAQHILQSLNPNALPSDLLSSYWLTQAQLYTYSHNNSQALALLNQAANFNSLSQHQWFLLNQLYAQIYINQNQTIAAINYLNQSMAYTQGDEQSQHVLIQTWNYLQSLPQSTITTLLQNTNLSTLDRGWLSLMQIANSADTSTLLSALGNWKSQYPEHPANALISLEFNTYAHSNNSPQKITLLLPLTGPLKNSATAIRNGFFAAYYYAKQLGVATPEINVVNSANGHIGELYQQAIAQGSQFIVGPLSKNNVALLANNDLALPTLALNSLGPNVEAHNLFQFGLSPLDESVQLAKRAFQDGHSRALIISTNNQWGQNLSQSFTNNWQQLGGSVSSQILVNNTHNLASALKTELGIDASNARYQALRQLLHTKMRFIPRRRQDIDVVFLAAEPALARQVRPLLKFYYAGDLSVYATSSIYPGIAHTSLDRDLDGIVFADMPWVLAPNQLPPSLRTIKNNIATLWPGSAKRYTKLYALGVDAYNLIGQIKTLSSLPQFGIYGATGRLSLTSSQHIFRKLLFAKMQKSAPALLERS